MENAPVRVEFLDRDGEPVEVLTHEVAPLNQAEAFRRKTNMGPELLRQALIQAWLGGVLDTNTVLRWQQRFGFVTFAELPLNHEEWPDFLDCYAKRTMT